jgi:hypothetical protein
MASIRLIAEDEATGKVKALYEEIKSEHGIDFVPNLYRAWPRTRTTSKPTGAVIALTLPRETRPPNEGDHRGRRVQDLVRPVPLSRGGAIGVIVVLS